MSGAGLRTLLEQRMEEHRRRAARWSREQAQAPEEETDDEPLLREHICENEAERHEWRAGILVFIRERIDPVEVYRLGEADLAISELLPEKPRWLEEEEYERSARASSALADRR
jgi:hypothetical protein